MVGKARCILPIQRGQVIRRHYSASAENALAVDEVILPPGTIKAVQSHGAATVGRVHESIFADVNADMADRVTAREEDQITRLQLSPRQLATGDRAHRRRLARQDDRCGIVKDIGDQPAAIKSTGRRIATPMVGRSYQ